MTKRKPGRPKLSRPCHPNRAIGRVDDETWERIKAGAAVAQMREGITFTQWLVQLADRHAKRELRG